MEENKSGIIHVRVPIEQVDALEKLSLKFGINRSRLIKFALQRLMETAEKISSSSDRENLIRTILSVSEGWKVPRPARYQTKRTDRPMLVAETPDNSWEKPRKRGRKKKSDSME